METIPYVNPDIEVKKIEEEWIIKLNRHYLPSVSIDESYVTLLKNDLNYKTYYRDSIKDALALLQGIEQRDKTLYELARWFVQLQEDFFYRRSRSNKAYAFKRCSRSIRCS